MKNQKKIFKAFVHPAMSSNVNPKRVAIIGGDKDTNIHILKEVLKHNSVENLRFSLQKKVSVSIKSQIFFQNGLLIVVILSVGKRDAMMMMML